MMLIRCALIIFVAITGYGVNAKALIIPSHGARPRHRTVERPFGVDVRPSAISLNLFPRRDLVACAKEFEAVEKLIAQIANQAGD